MHMNDDDIKIFHPVKKEGAGADLAELASLTEAYRRNGNMEKAEILGERIAQYTPETVCPQDAERLKSNELLQLRALMVFSAQIALAKYLPHQMLSAQAVNAMYNALSESSPGFFKNISDGSSFTFYYLSVRNNINVIESIGTNFAMLCDRDNNSYFISLGKRIFEQTDKDILELIDLFAFEE